MKPTRKDAWELLKEYNESEALLRHGLQVEAVMRHFAEYFGEDRETWGIVGLIHDLDYEKWPEEHCHKTKEILEERNWPQDLIRAVISHGYGICTDVEPMSMMEKTLYTVDELTGIINAACLVRPSRSVLDLKLKSLNKKFKDKKFAAGCDRNVILDGIERMGLEKNEVFQETIKGMQEHAEAIGLKGNL